MVIKHHYHEVLSYGESLMIFIIRSLQEREQYKRLTEIVEQAYPGAGNFKLPPGDEAVRITFAEGVKILNEAGIEAGEYEDLRQDTPSVFLLNFGSSYSLRLIGTSQLIEPSAPPKKKPWAASSSKSVLLIFLPWTNFLAPFVLSIPLQIPITLYSPTLMTFSCEAKK